VVAGVALQSETERHMKKFLLVVLAVALVGSSAAFARLGGWAVVSVSKIPDAWIAGKPLQLSWKVRQHGVMRLGDLHPTLEARSGARRIRGTTWAFGEDGEQGYRGRITFPDTGEWQVTIRSGFGAGKLELLPWRVVDSTRAVRGTVEEHLKAIGVKEQSEVEQGRRMFVALGCVTCHVHRAVNIRGEVADFGPDLTDRRFPPAYLQRYLLDPSIKPPTNGKQMPNLGLREKDILPVIAFINNPGSSRTAGLNR
jgi:hypothetical protein